MLIRECRENTLMARRILTIIEDWQINCVIFDLDGTLVDTLELHMQAFQELFNLEKLEIPYEEIAENMGRTPKDTLLSLLPQLANDHQTLEQLAAKKEQILAKLITKVKKMVGAEAILSLLKKQNLTLCLASSTPIFNVKKILAKANLGQYFDVIVTGEDITIGKPHPEVFLIAAQKGSCSSEHCLVIGDSPHDIKAAKNAGMKIIAIATGKHSKMELEQEQPDYLFPSIEMLLKKDE